MLDRNIHKTILLQILKDIYTDNSLGPILGFKGGTAANLFYNLGRFSVDLGFDLLDEKQKSWAKNHLKKDTVFLLKVRLEQEK
jgi:predicted nucleotidyltransferase component of viral defense system